MLFFTLAIFLLIVLPRLWSFGLFLDGAIYAAIARNMSEGVGSFWNPYYMGPAGTVCYWQPPFTMWIHSLLYRIFGDHNLVDPVLSFFFGCLIMLMVLKIYRSVCKDNTDWYPVFILSMMPMTSWIFSNNILEVPMTFFILLSVYVQLIGLTKKTSLNILYSFLSGALLALAVFSKSITGIFPLAIPVLHWIIFRKISFLKSLALSVVFAVSLILCFSSIVYFSGGEQFYRNYILNQILPSLHSQEKNSFFKDLGYLISELTLPLILSLSITVFAKTWKSIKLSKEVLFFFIIGLSATLPLFFFQKFRSHYIFTGLPFLTIAIALLFKPSTGHLQNAIYSSKKTLRAIQYISCGIIFSAIILMVAGKDYPYRYKEFKNDVYDQSLNIPPRSTVAACSSYIMDQYSTLALFQRYLKVSIEGGQNLSNSEWILEDKAYSCNVPGNCRKITPLNTQKYIMYHCIKN